MGISNDYEITAQLKLQADAFNQGFVGAASIAERSTDEISAAAARAAASAEASNQAFLSSVQKLNEQTLARTAALRELYTTMNSGLGSTEAIAEAEAALDKAMAAGAITSREQEQFAAHLTAAERALGVAMDETTVEIEANTGALAMNSRMAYSASALITDALTGQWGRSKREIATLTNQTGLLSSAFSFLVSPAGLATLAVAAFGVAVIKAHDAERDLQGQLMANGGAYGLTVEDIRRMNNALQATGATAGQAGQALSAIIASGKFTGNEFMDVARAAVAMSNMTGESVDKMVDKLSTLNERPVKAIEELNNKYNVLSPTEATEIQHLIEIGDKAGAAAAFLRDLANAEAARNQQFKDSGNIFDHFVDSMKTRLSQIGHGDLLGNIVNKADIKQQLNGVNAMLNEFITANPKAFGSDGKGGVTLLRPQDYMIGQLHQINGLIAEHAKLEQEVAQQTQKQAAAQDKAANSLQKVNSILGNTKGSYEALSKSGLGGVDLTGDLGKQLQMLEAAQKVSYDKREVFEADYWEYVKAHTAQGSEAYIQAFNRVQEADKRFHDQMLATLNKETEAQKRAAQQAAEAQRKASQAGLNDLQIQRDATAAYTQARIDADQRVADFAKKAFGDTSSQYRSALQQMEADQKQFNSRQREGDKEAAANARDIALGELATRQQQYQLLYDTSQISASQLAQLELTLASQRLAIETNYYQKLMLLDKGYARDYASDQKNLVLAQQQSAQQRLQIEDKLAKDQLKTWKKYSQEFKTEIAQGINSVIFQHTTLKNAVLSIAETMMERFITDQIQQIGVHAAAETAKTAATIAGTTARTTAETVAATTSNTLTAETAIKNILVKGIEVFANVYNAIAGIPYVGPFLAPVMAAAAGATIIGLVGRVASAEGGWDRVPFDGAMTELHKDEMVLPKPIADTVRDNVGGGGNGDQLHLHIAAMDAHSFNDFLRRNRSTLTQQLKTAKRRGHFVKK